MCTSLFQNENFSFCYSHLDDAKIMKFELLMYNNYMMLSLTIYFIKNANSIIRFCCEFQFFIFFVCAFFKFVLFFFLKNAFFIVIIFNVTFRDRRLNCEICFHFFVFFIFRFDFVMTKNEINSRDDDEKNEFVKNSKNCDLKTFFEFFDLSFFFLIEKKKVNAEIEKIDDENDENDEKLEKSKTNEKKFQIKKKNSQIKKTTKINREKLKIIIINVERKTEFVIIEIDEKNILLIRSRILIVFSIVFIAITIFLSILSCFFNNHNFFFVKKNLKNFTNMFVFIFVKTSCVLMTFFVK